MFQIKITGIKEIDAKLRGMEAKIAKKVLRKGMRAGLKIMLARVRALAPVGPSTGGEHPHTGGTLKKAIKIKAGRSRKGIRLAILLRNADLDWFYGAFVNEGTKRQKAQKFMEQAFKETKEEVRRVSTDAILAGIEEVMR